MKKGKAFLKSTSRKNPNGNFDYESYYELIDSGYSEVEIAREMNVSEVFLQRVKKWTDEGY